MLQKQLFWWFCLLSWDNSDRCGIFWLGWLMMSGDMRELRHLCVHLQPDFGEWVGVAPSMSLNYDLFFAIFYALAICHFAWPRKTDPTKSPEKSFFLSFPKETWHLVGSVFRREPKWKIGTALVSPHFFSPHQAAFLGHRWRNSHSFAKIRLGVPT